MITRNPVELDRLFEEALNARDLDALMQLYEPEAALMPMPGTTVVGTAAIREALAGFVAANPTIRTSGRLVAQTGDIALLANDWTLALTGPDGQPTSMSGHAIEIARRQADGGWLFVMDMPFGA
jgi:uncharacterized protein (TIGR02246 family)